jgi:hypothetical protein
LRRSFLEARRLVGGDFPFAVLFDPGTCDLEGSAGVSAVGLRFDDCLEVGYGGVATDGNVEADCRRIGLINRIGRIGPTFRSAVSQLRLFLRRLNRR